MLKIEDVCYLSLAIGHLLPNIK